MENCDILQVLPVGKELFACVRAFKEVGSCREGRNSLTAAVSSMVHEQDKGTESKIYNGSESRRTKDRPLLCCWKKIWSSSDSTDDSSAFAVQGINQLSSGCLSFCIDGKRLVWSENFSDFEWVSLLVLILKVYGFNGK